MRPPRGLDGPAPSWPAPLDAALEWWACTPARVRAVVRGAAAVLVVASATGGLLRGPWGPAVPVAVARVDLVAGAPVPAGAVVLADRPAGLVPPDALRATDGLRDAVTTGAVPAGSVLTARHLATDGPAALATPGTAVVPVPVALLPPLPLGSALDLAVTGFDGTASVVAADATVVADDGEWRWVRVDRADVAAVAAGLSDGSLVPAVLPPPRSPPPRDDGP